MKSSVWSSYYVDLSPEDMVREMVKHGFHHCELSDEHSCMLLDRGDPQTVGEEFRAFAEKAGMTFSQGHLILRMRLTEEEDRKILKRQLELFRAVGIRNAVLHLDHVKSVPGITPEEKIARNLPPLRELLSYIEGWDLFLCLENLRSPFDSAEALVEVIQKINHPQLAICLDTGHLHFSAAPDQKAFIQKAGHLIKALHLADNEGERDQHMMPFGKGTVDFLGVIREMKALGYEGLYNLEIPGERMAPLEVLGYKLDYLKQVMDYLDRVTEPDTAE